MAKALPYLGGQRLCLPVKCVALFDFGIRSPSVKIIFTDDEEEIINWKSPNHPDWVIISHDGESLLDIVKKRISDAGYEMTVRHRRPSCISFNLWPSQTKTGAFS